MLWLVIKVAKPPALHATPSSSAALRRDSVHALARHQGRHAASAGRHSLIVGHCLGYSKALADETGLLTEVDRSLSSRLRQEAEETKHKVGRLEQDQRVSFRPYFLDHSNVLL